MSVIGTSSDFRRDLWDGNNKEWIYPDLPIRRRSCKWFWSTGTPPCAATWEQSVRGGLFSQTFSPTSSQHGDTLSFRQGHTVGVWELPHL